MAENTAIEWCDASLSPWWGCTKVSPACAHCYAEAIDARFAGGGHWGKGAPRLPKPNFERDAMRLDRKAAKLGRKLTVFPSMCDPFDEEVSIEMFADFLSVIHRTKNLVWLLLTKRPESWRARVCAAGDWMLTHGKIAEYSAFINPWVHVVPTPPANIWIGATVEDQQRAEERIPHLLSIPAKVRFLSCEPLLEAVDLLLYGEHSSWTCPDCGSKNVRADNHDPDEGKWWQCHDCNASEYGEAEWKSDIHWVICGGESGPNARPMHPDWARSLRDQCAAAGVPYFFKQWGEWMPLDQVIYRLGEEWSETGSAMIDRGIFVHDWPDNTKSGRFGKKIAGRLLDGREHNAFPEIYP
ncbi:MAG: phage Gp37/Gp68 family protein [Chthoniobacterales bacterium]|nr:phage Gp37/Gp68 family protein [Chthoniobacterales bacterium]